jgi:hypothetical protein
VDYLREAANHGSEILSQAASGRSLLFLPRGPSFWWMDVASILHAQLATSHCRNDAPSRGALATPGASGLRRAILARGVQQFVPLLCSCSLPDSFSADRALSLMRSWDVAVDPAKNFAAGPLQFAWQLRRANCLGKVCPS